MQEEFINCMDWCSDSGYNLSYLNFMNDKDMFYNIDLRLIKDFKFVNNMYDYSYIDITFQLKPGITNFIDDILALGNDFITEFEYLTVNRSTINVSCYLTLDETSYQGDSVSIRFNANGVEMTEITKIPTSYYSLRDDNV